MMTPEHIRRAYSGAVVVYVVTVAAALLIREYVRERRRVADVVAETTADLNARADAIRERIPGMIESEHETGADDDA